MILVLTALEDAPKEAECFQIGQLFHILTPRFTFAYLIEFLLIFHGNLCALPSVFLNSQETRSA